MTRSESTLTVPRIAAVTFDMDGLMFNTEDLYDRVGQILLEARGQDFTLELKLAMMGLPGSVAWEVMRQRCGIDDSVEQLQAEADQIFSSMLPAEIRTMPGLEAILSKLESHNIPKAVATSSHRRFASQALGHFDLQPRFEFVLTSDDVTHGKPHPEIYLTAARRLGVDPGSMLVLEDSQTGSRAAAAAGAYTVAIPTQHSRGMDFSHTHHVADRLDDDWIMNLFE